MTSPSAPRVPSFADPARVVPRDGAAGRLGGEIRRVPEDFRVEEIPLYRALGRGDHVHFQIEKRGMSTFDAVLRVSKGAKVSEKNIGYAGLKDTRAVTRQFMSVPRVPMARVLGIEHPRFRVLSAANHPSPLKVGHHRGNRFTIRIRDIDRQHVPAARRALEELATRGMPNAYGSQRFGVRQDGHLLGRALVEEDWAEFIAELLGRPSPLEFDPRMVAAREAFDRGDLEACHASLPMKQRSEKKAASVLLRTGSPREAFLALGRRPRRMWVAAWQSFLFNRILERRVADDTFDRVLPGDLAALEASGACFPTSATAPPPPARNGKGERLVPTGPLLGHDLRLATGGPGTIERTVLRGGATDPEAFRADHVRGRALRRPLCVPVREASLEEEAGGAVVVRFVLPPGAFATVVLEVLIGSPV